MKEISLEESLLEELSLNGFNGLTRCMEILLNEAMKVERSKVLGAYPYERSEERQGYANGYGRNRSPATRQPAIPAY